jgi:tRNA G37 N-methylase Trm5
MVTYLDKIKQDVERFINCNGKTVLIVGAGGGKLFGYADSAQKVFALDCNSKALDKLAEIIHLNEQEEKYELVCGYFETIDIKADVVIFEFSLHEIPDAYETLKHAKKLSNRVIVVEHTSDSEWICLAQEDQNVKRVEEGLTKFEVIKTEYYVTQKEFKDLDDLKTKLGYIDNDRLPSIFEKYKSKVNHSVEMKYRISEI